MVTMALQGVIQQTFIRVSPNVNRYYDNTVPVLQSAVITGLVNQGLKVLFGRKRPFAARR